ncbi:hypothetical protein [Anabaena catenula]|uniref:Uncharacterized protein n=1 Tax=Anabaena catenula FACHB-362 TaxID=2692877 RepID=A0ABR8IXZ3_9NOST|nr:hypothetical protein [Anabaena catenula]MBD2690932.1 hypothetical protein [Anabaena catenula FACHB-362]
MKTSKSFTTKPWWKIYSRIKGRGIEQTKEQTINNLVVFYLFCIGLTVFLAAINVWDFPIKQGLLGLLSGIPFFILGYDFIKDVIATEFDAAIKNIEKRLKNEFQQEIKELQNQHQSFFDRKYMSYIKQSLQEDTLKLKRVTLELKEEFAENPDEFHKNLDEEFQNSKDSIKVRSIIHDLNNNDEFLQNLAVRGIIDGLALKDEEIKKRVNIEGDLYQLRLDIYVYLSAWLICSIDNDLGSFMPIDPIGMGYKNENDKPDKKSYEKVITAIVKLIESEKFTELTYYPDSDPLSCSLTRTRIVNYLTKLIDLIDKYYDSTYI